MVEKLLDLALVDVSGRNNSKFNNLYQICRTNSDRMWRESPIKKSDCLGQRSQSGRGSIKMADLDFSTVVECCPC